MKILSISILFLSNYVTVINAVDNENLALDKSRGARSFLANKRPSGHTYLETMKLLSETKMNIAGTQMDSVTSMRIESLVTVSDNSKAGTTHVTAELTRMEFQMETAGAKMECDTDIDETASDDLCTTMYDALHKASNYDINSDGTLVDATADSKGVVVTTGTDQDSAELPGSGNVNFQENWAQTERLLKLVPSDSEIKPGDTWDSSEDMDDLGHFTGKTTLLGYRDIDGHDCAIFSSVGMLHVDYEKTLKKLFGGNDMMMSIMKDVNISDASIDTLIYYDYSFGLVRWSKTHQTMNFEAPDILGQGTMSFPIDQTIVTTSRVKE